MKSEPPMTSGTPMNPDIQSDSFSVLDDLTLMPGEACAITGSGGKTTLLWYLAGLARQKAPVLVTVTAKMFPPPKEFFDLFMPDPAAYDPESHAAGTVVLISQGVDGRGKLLGIAPRWVSDLTRTGIYLIMEADGSRGLPLKMWKEHEPPVYPGTGLTLGVIPVSALGTPVSADNVYNWPDFARVTNLAAGDLMTRGAFADLIFHPGGLFKNSPGRKVLIINQADTDEKFAQAQDLSRYLASDPRSHDLTAIICMSLEELLHENHRHYSCRRIIPADEPK